MAQTQETLCRVHVPVGQSTWGSPGGFPDLAELYHYRCANGCWRLGRIFQKFLGRPKVGKVGWVPGWSIRIGEAD